MRSLGKDQTNCVSPISIEHTSHPVISRNIIWTDVDISRFSMQLPKFIQYNEEQRFIEEQKWLTTHGLENNIQINTEILCNRNKYSLYVEVVKPLSRNRTNDLKSY